MSASNPAMRITLSGEMNPPARSGTHRLESSKGAGAAVDHDSPFN